VLLLLPGRGEDDARDVAPPIVGAHRGEHVQAAQVWHHEIEQHETDVGLVLERVHRFASVVDERDAKRPLLELHLDDATDVWFIVGDEHVARRAGRRAFHESSDQGGDVFPVAPQLKEQLADVRARVEEHQQNRFGRQHRDDRDTVAMLEHRGHEVATAGRRSEIVGGTDDGRNTRGDVVGVQSGADLTIDQQPVATQHDGGVDSFTLPDGSDQITNAWHPISRGKLPGKVVAKLEINIVEVKRDQSLEECLTSPYPSPLSSPNMNQRSLGLRPKIVLLAMAAIAVGGVACGDLTGVPASLPTLADSTVVYAINGAPPGAPTALHVYAGQLFSADASFVFDVAFDIDASGHAVILPQRAVASGLAATHTVGLQTATGTYESLTRAPTSGYRADTALVATPGVPVLVQSTDPNTCGVSLTGTVLYAKLVIRSVDVASRQMVVQFTTDPNCGFRSFLPGIPKD